MIMTSDSQSPSPPAPPTIPLIEKKPAAVKLAVITGIINIVLMMTYFALVWYSNETRSGLPGVIVQVWCAAAILMLLVTIVGCIFSIIVLAQHKRWKKAGLFGLITSGLPALVTLLLFIFLRVIASG